MTTLCLPTLLLGAACVDTREPGEPVGSIRQAVAEEDGGEATTNVPPIAYCGDGMCNEMPDECPSDCSDGGDDDGGSYFVSTDSDSDAGADDADTDLPFCEESPPGDPRYQDLTYEKEPITYPPSFDPGPGPDHADAGAGESNCQCAVPDQMGIGGRPVLDSPCTPGGRDTCTPSPATRTVTLRRCRAQIAAASECALENVSVSAPVYCNSPTGGACGAPYHLSAQSHGGCAACRQRSTNALQCRPTAILPSPPPAEGTRCDYTPPTPGVDGFTTSRCNAELQCISSCQVYRLDSTQSCQRVELPVFARCFDKAQLVGRPPIDPRIEPLPN